MERWCGIAVAAVMAVLLLLVEHWGPWQMLVRKRFHPIANYVLGVLAFSLPLTVLFAAWGSREVVLAMWTVIVASGLAVAGAYWIDNWIDTRIKLRAAEKESGILREEMIDGKGPEAS